MEWDLNVSFKQPNGLGVSADSIAGFYPDRFGFDSQRGHFRGENGSEKEESEASCEVQLPAGQEIWNEYERQVTKDHGEVHGGRPGQVGRIQSPPEEKQSMR